MEEVTLGGLHVACLLMPSLFGSRLGNHVEENSWCSYSDFSIFYVI